MNEKRPLSATLFALRLLSGITGGVVGMLIAFVVYFIMSTFIPSGEAVSSLSFFAIIVMAFVATLSANTITAVMLTFMDHEKYSRRKTTITQVFLFNLVLFFLTIPLYLIAIPLEITTGVVALHFLLSAYVSALIMEVLAGYEYSLVGIYSSSLGIFVSIGIALLMLNSNVSQLVLTLGAMPAVWFILELVGGFVELIYDNFLRFYGVDALNVETDLGGDTMIEKESEDEEDEDAGEGDDDRV
ncbi:hypothetical protein KJ657_01360 [Patescibacteria group bacterium]|nr:hypothetical protein [Patescibacteria group bacterium]MBU1015716.1 hypothetical protein [Patescibacteria group bacterium]MBU1684888.1 hypothetical protein [Patescibacteria group bacterium]MBU1938654.1 hypothetical protein [Patescibacteria group bacterium]